MRWWGQKHFVSVSDKMLQLDCDCSSSLTAACPVENSEREQVSVGGNFFISYKRLLATTRLIPRQDLAKEQVKLVFIFQ